MVIDVAGNRVYAYAGARAFDASQPTVLFVHGAANDHSVFQWQSRYFASHGKNVLAVDLPGHGRSDGEALQSVEAIADWLRDLMDAAGVADASVVGHSMGALGSLEFAARNPHRVRKLALLGPAAPMSVSDDLLAAAARNDHVAYELITGWSYSTAGQLGGGQVPGVWMLGSAMRLLERCRDGVLSADLIACHRYANGVAAATSIRCPALMVLATRDLMAPLRNAQPLLAALPYATTIRLDGAGHALMAERPREVLDALRPFV